MKRFIALLLTLILVSTCIAYGEADEELFAVPATPAFTISLSDLSEVYIQTARDIISTLVSARQLMSDEEYAAWKPTQDIFLESIQTLKTDDVTALLGEANDNINAMDVFTPLEKSLLKYYFFSALYDVYELSNSERDLLYRTGKLFSYDVAENFEGDLVGSFEDMINGLKTDMSIEFIRSELMHILRLVLDDQSEQYVEQLQDPHTLMTTVKMLSLSTEHVLKGITEEESAIYNDVLASLNTQIDALELDFENLSEGDLDAIAQVVENLVQEYSVPEETLLLSYEEIAELIINYHTMTDDQVHASNSIIGNAAWGLGHMDPDSLETYQQLILEMMNAMTAQDLETVYDLFLQAHMLLMRACENRYYETFCSMSSETLVLISAGILHGCHLWDQNTSEGKISSFIQDLHVDSLKIEDDRLESFLKIIEDLFTNPDLSKEDNFKLIDILNNSNNQMYKTHENQMRLLNVLFKNLINMMNSGTLKDRKLDTIRITLESLAHSVVFDKNPSNVTLEDVIALRNGESIESIADQLRALGKETKRMLVETLSNDLMFCMLRPEEGAELLHSIDLQLYEAVKTLKLDGTESTSDQLQAMEKAVASVFRDKEDIPEVLKMSLTARNVYNCFLMSTLTEEEQELIVTIFKTFSQILADGNPEELALLKNFNHQLTKSI